MACGLVDGRFRVVLRGEGMLIIIVEADVRMKSRLLLRLQAHVTQECCSNACDTVRVRRGDGQ
jgi:hypothetical protein